MKQTNIETLKTPSVIKDHYTIKKDISGICPSNLWIFNIKYGFVEEIM